MHLYVKKIEDKDCGSNGIMLTHDIVRFFFNPEKSFFENLGTSKSYSFAHFKNAREIKDINVRKINGFLASQKSLHRKRVQIAYVTTSAWKGFS